MERLGKIDHLRLHPILPFHPRREKNSLLLYNFHFSRLSRRTKVAALFHPFHPDRRTRSLGGRTTWVLDRLFTLPPLTNIKDPSRLRAFSISVGP